MFESVGDKAMLLLFGTVDYWVPTECLVWIRVTLILMGHFPFYQVRKYICWRIRWKKHHRCWTGCFSPDFSDRTCPNGGKFPNSKIYINVYIILQRHGVLIKKREILSSLRNIASNISFHSFFQHLYDCVNAEEQEIIANGEKVLLSNMKIKCCGWEINDSLNGFTELPF